MTEKSFEQRLPNASECSASLKELPISKSEYVCSEKCGS